MAAHCITSPKPTTAASLWELDLDEGDLEMKRRLSDPMAAFDATPDGKSIFIFGQSMQKLDGRTAT